jgi:hypothetical protein
MLAPDIEALELSPMARVLRLRLPADVWSSLSTDQLNAIAAATISDGRHHQVAYRVSLPISRGRGVYFAIFAGAERRNRDRLRVEGQTGAFKQSAFVGFCLLMIATTSLFGSACIAYLVKSMAGIDIFPGPSPFHPLFEFFRVK